MRGLRGVDGVLRAAIVTGITLTIAQQPFVIFSESNINKLLVQCSQ